MRITDVDLLSPEGLLHKTSLLIGDGRILEIGGDSRDTVEIRLPGRLLAPGLIDIHCDALEKAVEPRPNVRFPDRFAFEFMDRRACAAGITTIYHALSFAGPELGLRSPPESAALIRALLQHRPKLRADHRIHIRFELTDAASLPLLYELLTRHRIDLLSFMDHSPGQGQFPTEESYLRYLMLTYGRTETQARQLLRAKSTAAAISTDCLHALAQTARNANVFLACHDIHEPSAPSWWAQQGVTIAEFPINQAAAAAACAIGMTTVFGCPNILRGASSGFAMKAIDAIRAGLASSLCSDYVPEAFLPAVLKVGSEFEDPVMAFNLGTAHPAAALGLADRGTLAVGKRADLLVLNPGSSLYSPERVYIGGKLAYQQDFA